MNRPIKTICEKKIKRCRYRVIDRSTNKKRYCKNNSNDHYCSLHNEHVINIDDLIRDDNTNNLLSDIKIDENEYGRCCFCNEGCNKHSQSCGRCARSIGTGGEGKDGEWRIFNYLRQIAKTITEDD